MKFEIFFKSRLFVTNSLNFLPQVDEILLIENGQISEKGTYDELKNAGAAFTEFIRNSMDALHEEVGKEVDEDKFNFKDQKAYVGQVIGNKPPSRQISKISTRDKPIEPEKKKVGENIIVKEKIETGKVKF